MRVIDLKQINQRKYAIAKRKRRVRRRFVAIVLVAFMGFYSYIVYQRPLPEAAARQVSSLQSKAVVPPLAWPAYGQAAVGSLDYGLLEFNGTQTPTPTASVAKIMTALAVLKQKPLNGSKTGPELTLDDQDVASYDNFVGIGGSVVRVESGEQLSEYEALQAMLLPSANNMAESLARWAFGSQEAYATYANDLALKLGMTKTHIADASGFSSETVSTARDLLQLGLVAMADPTIADIVSQTHADVPVAGRIFNTNWQLGNNDVVGIKTGNTDEAGGVYLFAASHSFSNNKKQLVVGVIMAAPNLSTAMNDSLPLLSSVYDGFTTVNVAVKGQVIGDYTLRWGAKNQLVAAEDLSIFTWKGFQLEPVVTMDPLSASFVKGANIGTVNASSKIDQKTINLQIKNETTSPKWYWHLLHP